MEHLLLKTTSYKGFFKVSLGKWSLESNNVLISKWFLVILISVIYVLSQITIQNCSLTMVNSPLSFRFRMYLLQVGKNKIISIKEVQNVLSFLSLNHT